MLVSAPPSGIHNLFRYIPEVLDFDPASIEGNLSDELKRVGAKVFAHFAGKANSASFATWVIEQIRPVEMNVYGVEDGKLIGKARAQCTYEVVANKDMGNVFGVLHGACAALLLEICTVSPIVMLGLALGHDTTGITQGMNYVYHQPARLGRKLRIVSSTMSIEGRIRTARGEIWDGDTLCISCVHSIVHIGKELPGKTRAKL